jgi:hypothetical protein
MASYSSYVLEKETRLRNGYASIVGNRMASTLSRCNKIYLKWTLKLDPKSNPVVLLY